MSNNIKLKTRIVQDNNRHNLSIYLPTIYCRSLNIKKGDKLEVSWNVVENSLTLIKVK